MPTAEQKALHAARMREWRANNPEASKAASKRRDEAVKADPERMARYREYQRDWQKARRLTNPEDFRRWQRDSYVRTKYGIETADYELLLAQQGGRCAICGTDNPGKNKKFWSIDHDHETGQVRGLLCSSCNRGIGLLGDNVERLEAALSYLRSQAPA